MAPLHASTNELIAVVRRDYVPDSPTHDHSHLERVASLAHYICSIEGGTPDVVVSASWLHDLHREAGGRFFVAPEDMDERARTMLSTSGVPESIHEPILDAVHYTDRYSFSDRPTYAASIDAKIVRDADMLDAIGAIGVARAFSFGGAHNIPLWATPAATDDEAGMFVQSRRPDSTIHHFAEKLLRLSSELETFTAIQLGRRRAAYMFQFVDMFKKEWLADFDPTSLAEHAPADRSA